MKAEIKRGVGRPRKDPQDLVHNTRKRPFIQVPVIGNFYDQIETLRGIVAAFRSQQEGREIPIGKISMAGAIRFAVVYCIQSLKGNADE